MYKKASHRQTKTEAASTCTNMSDAQKKVEQIKYQVNYQITMDLIAKVLIFLSSSLFSLSIIHFRSSFKKDALKSAFTNQVSHEFSGEYASLFLFNRHEFLWPAKGMSYELY